MISVTRIEIEADRRYRVLVLLERSDRPVNWKFYCPRCQMPVAELINQDIVTMTDMIDMENIDNALVGARCDGRFQGGRCNVWFYFKSLQDKQ